MLDLAHDKITFAAIVAEHQLAAKEYLPEKIKTLFLCESPPIPDDPNNAPYFYKVGKQNNILLATLAKATLNIDLKDIEDKAALLEEFKREGLWLIDAVEQPINQYTDRWRRKIMSSKEQIEDLLKRLGTLISSGHFVKEQSNIIVLKKAVCDIYINPLKNHGFNVLNKEKIDFPKYTNDIDVIKGIKEALKIDS